MTSETFYTQVSSWISTFRSMDGLMLLQKFIELHHIPIQEVKDKLYAEIKARHNVLLAMPKLVEVDGSFYLANDPENTVKAFITRRAAMERCSELTDAGINCQFMPFEKPLSSWYKIQVFI